MLTQQDLKQLAQKGISEQQIETQLGQFKTGFPFLKLEAAAAIGHGIVAPDNKEGKQYVEAWQQYKAAGKRVVKFVPASGAASRMFKDMFAFVDADYDKPTTDFEKKYFDNIEKFAFYGELDAVCQKNNGKGIKALMAEGNYKAVAANMLKVEGLNYGQLPKGLLLFHNYPEGPRTPMEEHLVEGALYAASNGEAHVHFTVSHEHMELFKQKVAQKADYYAQKYGIHYDITFSEQKPSTDTVAANPDGTPFRTADGKLLFRPGGHGALIENLNEQDADIVFIKNIDNVVPDRLKGSTVEFKQLLAGVLVTEQKRVIEALRQPGLSAEERERLNRPIRVCGVVRNTGEPGGGPFRVREADGSISNQILESVQIPDKELMAKSKYFNPVDLVCAIKDYEGKPFDLLKFVDPKTGFISQKSKDGRDLLALELPGLWNGAMSKWNTIFVEVPVSTFNPVKTVNDLLREQHQ
jgi:hypothetical protein